MSEPAEILLVRLSSLGDIMLATPVAAELRRLFPRAHLRWLVDRGYRPLLQHLPHVDEVNEFDYRGRHQGPGGVARLAGELGRVDVMVDLQNKMRTILLAVHLQPQLHLRLRLRPGLAWLRATVGRDAILRAPHQVTRNLQVIAALGAHLSGWPQLQLGPGWRAEAAAAVAGLPRPLVGLVPGSRHPTKQWPARHWVGLLRRCRKSGLGAVLLGSSEEYALLDSLRQQAGGTGIRNLAGGDLRRLAGLLAACDVVVAGDCGPGHLAAALDVPVLSLFGPTCPERWAPRARRGKVLRLELPCSPCSNHGSSHCHLGTHECLQQLMPDRVWLELEGILAHVC